ncbi:MAG TPA: ATP-dependent DNA helicase RecG [Streptosporangiaceae bacterium]|nr:ATP-dependent DNA helicase RecG [Streptosporangiaceae bacterium]
MARLDDRLDREFDPRTAKVLAKALDVHTVGELLRHYPRRYEQRGELTDLASLRDGEHVTVLAQISAVTTRTMKNRRGKLTEVTVTDGHGTLTLAFFRQPWREKDMKPGLHGLFAGQVSSYGRKRQLIHPDCELLGTGDPGTEMAAEHAAQVIPVYPATKDLPSWKIAKAIRTVLDTLDIADDPLPAEVRTRYGLQGQLAAWHGIHRPVEFTDIQPARLRLKWDEAFALQAVLAQRRRAEDALPATPRIPRRGGLLEAFDARLPFSLTKGQLTAGEEITTALCREHPMHRLLQGEVGSGKTLVAVRAMLQVIDDGGQAALLAPTEVLAQQHYRSISALLGPLGRAGELDGAQLDDPGHATRVALLTGSQGAKARRAALDDVASGAAGIVIGTHTLLYHRVRLDDQVVFGDLGLVVIDEQHRFGVQQRDALREKARGSRPHVLVMTATPIPRTVAMTVYGDLDVCTLSELPAGRDPITTHVVPSADKPHYLTRTWERLREEVAGGGQAYVVCPRIGEQEDAPPAGAAPDADADPGAGLGDDGSAGDYEPPDEDAGRPPRAVLDMAAELADGPLAGLRMRILHGRMPADDKDAAMRAFADGSVDVLVATTVVEVGVDVPNATIMVIMDADRFGVSQLHQLRGRVGRGGKPGLCLLVTDAPPGSPARDRLDAVAATVDGFALSRLDLEQRREGNVLGAVQAGRKSGLKMLTLLQDEELIVQARAEAQALVDADPRLAAHPALAGAIRTLLDEEQAKFLEKA